MGEIQLVNLRKDYGKENVIPDLNLRLKMEASPCWWGPPAAASPLRCG